MIPNFPLTACSGLSFPKNTCKSIPTISLVNLLMITFGSAINYDDLTSFLRAMLTCLWYTSRSSSTEDLQEIVAMNTSVGA